jgi:hypothetical protein
VAALSAPRQAAALAALLLAACSHAPLPAPAPRAEAAPPRPPPPAGAPAAVAPPSEADPPGVVRLRCDDGTRLRVAFADDEARVAGLPLGEQTLLRDAGGVTPQQSVFSNAAVRAEFGLDADSGGAQLHLLAPPAQTLHCRRD